MTIHLLEYDDVLEIYQLADEYTYHDAWYFQGIPVSETDPTAGQVLAYNAVSEEWEPVTPSGGAPGPHASTHQNGGGDEIATATAAANAIPKAGAGSKLDVGWLPTGSTSTTVCIGNDSRLSDARTPTAHASTHNAGGGDAMAIDAAAGTGSLRTLSTTATSACAGNDSRLSNARTPTAHKTTHATGGSDALAASDIGAEASANKGAASGYCGLDATTKVATANLGLGTANSSRFLRGDRTWIAPAALLVELTNKTGSASVTGDIVQIYGAGGDGWFDIADANPQSTPDNHIGFGMGVVYDNGIADGNTARVVVSGLCQVYCECGTRGQPLTAHESVDGHGAGIEYSATSPCYAQGLGVLWGDAPSGGGLTWCILQVQHDINILITAPS